MIEDEHLGDGCYVHFDGHNVWLTANAAYNHRPTDKVALEPRVIIKFQAWLKRLNDAKAEFLAKGVS